VGGFPICIIVEDVAALWVTNGTDINGRDCLPIRRLGMCSALG